MAKQILFVCDGMRAQKEREKEWI